MLESISRAIREARETKGLSRKEVAQRARVPFTVVRNLEEGRWAELPERFYLRHFLERIARVLDLSMQDLDPLLDSLPSEVDLSSVVVKKTAGEGGWRWWTTFALGFVLVAGLGLFLWWGEYGPGFSWREGRGKGQALSRIQDEPVHVPSSSKAKSGRGEAEAALVKVHHLDLVATGMCWVRMVLENGGVKDFILRPGEKYSLDFREGVDVRLGNPGGVELFVDGDPLNIPRALGKPLDIRVTSEGAEVIQGK